MEHLFGNLPASVYNGVVGHASGLESGPEELGVQLLVLRLVPLGVRSISELTWALVPGNLLVALSESMWACLEMNSPGVPSSNVGRDATDLTRGAGGLVDLGKSLGTRFEVVIPAQPASVASVDVHDNVVQVELLQGVLDTFFVSGFGVLARLLINVGHQVWQGVGLDDKGECLVGVLLEDSHDYFQFASARSNKPTVQ